MGRCLPRNIGRLTEELGTSQGYVFYKKVSKASQTIQRQIN